MAIASSASIRAPSSSIVCSHPATTMQRRLEWLRDVYLTMPMPYAELTELARSNVRSVALQEHQEQCWGFSQACLIRWTRLRTTAPTTKRRVRSVARSSRSSGAKASHRGDAGPTGAISSSRFAAAMSPSCRMNPLVGQVLTVGVANSMPGLSLGRPVNLHMAGPGQAAPLVPARWHARYASPLGRRWLEDLPVEPDASADILTAVWSALPRIAARECPTSMFRAGDGATGPRRGPGRGILLHEEMA